MIYRGVAIAPDGNRIASVTGTIQECSNWADNLIRSVGECRIDINLKEQKAKTEKWIEWENREDE